MKEWTFVTNHGLVLSYVAEHLQITNREIASAVGITERRVQRIIADLEKAGYIAKKRSGRHNTYVVNAQLTMRHPTHRDRAVGELLTVLKPMSRPALKKKLPTTEMPRLIPDSAMVAQSTQPPAQPAGQPPAQSAGENAPFQPQISKEVELPPVSEQRPAS